LLITRIGVRGYGKQGGLSMGYRFTRIWGHASAIVGLGLITVAFLLAASALFIVDVARAHGAIAGT
jgi:hypothetical protein